MKLNLYYISAEAHTGDSDGPYSLDLFVWAQSVGGAEAIWKNWMEQSNMTAPPDSGVRVFHIPALPPPHIKKDTDLPWHTPGGVVLAD